MDKSYSQRYLNVGFSGGEKKKTEILLAALKFRAAKPALIAKFHARKLTRAIKFHSSAADQSRPCSLNLAALTLNKSLARWSDIF